MPRRSRSSLAVFVPICILLLLASPARAQQGAAPAKAPAAAAPAAAAAAAPASNIRTGVFYLVEGLSYWTPTLSGTTNAKGEFRYRAGETVTFSVGDLVLGSTLVTGKRIETPYGSTLLPAGRVSTSYLTLGADADISKLKYPRVTNQARFLQSLDEDGNVENGITISAKTRDVVSQYRHKITFMQKEADFGSQPDVAALFSNLSKTLRTGPQARNYERWTLMGIRLETDVKIPTRDGLYVLADVFRPITEGKYPPLVQLGSYGKVFIFRGCNCNQDDVLAHEVALDKFYEGNPDNISDEVSETTQMWYWVPKGYVAIRVDGPGICNSPGILNQYSAKEAEALADSVEWAAKQPWSNGNVGTFGSSLFGINQVNVAALQPPHLKAQINGAGDSDRYRQVVYAGGILNANARKGWNEHTNVNRCLGQKNYESIIGDKVTWWLANPFNERPAYGTYSDTTQVPAEMDGDLSRVVVPFMSLSPQEHSGSEHVRGGIELFMGAATKPEDKQLRVITGDFNRGYLYGMNQQKYFLDFYEYWLKGVQNNVMKLPRVATQIRTGGGGWFWQNANEYPPANTQYRKYYLDATPSGWAGDGKRSDFLKISSTPPTAGASKSYSADVEFNADRCGEPGISFISEPMAADQVVNGFVVARVFMSSTSNDADAFVSVRVMDKNNEEISYALSSRPNYPVGKGWQRASMRKLDEKMSTMYRPWPTFKKADYAPLKSPSEVVQLDIEVEPTTALIRKGDRIRVDIQPVDGCAWGTPHYINPEYHKGASNTIYTGADHNSWIQLPIIPQRTIPAVTDAAPVKTGTTAARK